MQPQSLDRTGSKRWRDSIRKSNGKFFPTIPGDSTGFKKKVSETFYLLTVLWFVSMCDCET
jgi:hypothetical protein